MLRVALTGNIASGKSAVARVWQEQGAAVIDADELAREAVGPGTPALARISARFGSDVLRADGSLDRAALRRLVFADTARRAALEAIVHPEIRRLRDAREARLAGLGTRIVVNVIPLLFETGMQHEFDEVVLVDAPEEVRRARLVELRGLDDGEARAMMEAQMPASAKRAGASIVIENDGTREALEQRAREVWLHLQARADECA